jgi:hypothetical protein
MDMPAELGDQDLHEVVGDVVSKRDIVGLNHDANHRLGPAV